MKQNSGLRAFSMLLAFLLVSMTFMPIVSAQANEQTVPDNGKVIRFNPPDLKIIENTHTSYIVDVGDIRINLASNQEHTVATMTIKNVKTNEQQKMDFTTSQESGIYITTVMVDGKPGPTITTTYDPFEPGSMKTVLENNAQDADTAINMALAAQSYYYWDGVYFTSGSGIKYPHPDYTSYGAYAYEDFYISGSQLYHRHIDNTYSTTIASMPAAVAGGVIAGVISADPIVAGIVGAVIALLIGGATCAVLLDEQGCIWEWDAKSWATIVIPVAPYLYSLPKFERIGPYTMWNALGISNP